MIQVGDGAKKWIYLVSGVFCFILALILTSTFRGSFAPEEEIVPAPLAEEATAAPAAVPYDASGAPAAEKWAVYVTGEVHLPGVYEIEPGRRIDDAIKLAGGFSRSADREAVNLAAKLTDETHISVPALGESQESGRVSAENTPAVRSANNPASYGAVRSNNAPASNANSKININTADASALATLPGVGPNISQSIVAYRDEHGPFKSAEGLRFVKGIGEKKYEAICELVTVGN